MSSIGVNTGMENRKNIAALNGIINYSGTATQNTNMLNLLKNGKLIKSIASSTTTTQTSTNSNTSSTYTVKSGDTLWNIALAKLGSGSRHIEIKILNGLISDNLRIEQVLKIPSGPSTVATTCAPKIGDKVIVNGTIYGNGNGSGGAIKKTNETMYITDVVNSNQFKYYIGVAETKGGTRQGWVDKSSVKN